MPNQTFNQEQAEEVRNKLIDEIRTKVRQAVQESANELCGHLLPEDKNKIIDLLCLQYLAEIQESSSMAALILHSEEQTRQKIDEVISKMFIPLSELQKDVDNVNSEVKDVKTQLSFLVSRFNDINPTIQNNIQSFKESTESYKESTQSYKEIAHDLRERVKGLATNESVALAVANAVGSVPKRGEFYSFVGVTASLLLGVLTFAFFALDSKYTGFQQTVTKQLEGMEKVQNEILQRTISSQPAKPTGNNQSQP